MFVVVVGVVVVAARVVVCISLYTKSTTNILV
jgi:hypothetical protein